MCDPNYVSKLLRRKILHVDHYPANIALVQEIISRREDLQLITATTGVQCIQLASDHLPSVILMETILRDMEGIEVLKELRRAETTANIPVIALSSFGMSGQVETAMAAGYFSCLAKPFRIQNLLQAIEDALKGAARGREAFHTV